MLPFYLTGKNPDKTKAIFSMSDRWDSQIRILQHVGRIQMGKSVKACSNIRLNKGTECRLEAHTSMCAEMMLVEIERPG